MGRSGTFPPALRGEMVLVTAEPTAAIHRCCAEVLFERAGLGVAALAVTARPDPTEIVEAWRTVDGNPFRDVRVLALGATGRSADAAVESDRSVGVIQPVAGAIAPAALIERIERQVRAWYDGEGPIAVFLDGLTDAFDPGEFLETLDGLSTVISSHDAIGVVHVSPETPALPAIGSRFGTVVSIADDRTTAPGDATAGITARPPVSPDDAFDVLGSRRRRSVLRYLTDRPDGSATVRELAEALARDGDGETTEAVRRSYVGLLHTDVPKLSEHQVVSYDEDRERIELTDRAGWVEPYLALTDSTFGDPVT